MNPIGCLITMELEDRRTLAPTATERRIFARAATRIGGRFAVALFGVSGSSARIAAACTHEESGRLAHRLATSLRTLLHLPGRFAPARRERVGPERLRMLVDSILEDTRDDPAHEATNLPDLLGLRRIGSTTDRILHQLLPQLRRSHLLSILGCDRLAPGTSLAHLRAATATSIAATDLGSRSREVVAARRAAVRAAREIGASTDEIRDILGMSRNGIYNLELRTASPLLVDSIRLLLTLFDSMTPQTRGAAQGHTVPETDFAANVALVDT